MLDLVEVTHMEFFFCANILSTATSFGSFIFIELDDDLLPAKLVVDPVLRFLMWEDATLIGFERITAEWAVAFAWLRIRVY